MKNVKTLSSFADLGKTLGLSSRQKSPKPRRCFHCGGEMRHIEGTNVFVCTGTKKDKDGKEKQCMNRLLVGVKGA